jgi:TetR/AcrR family transcriptional repressor of nem operon
MRYTNTQKEETRRIILDKAAARFRKEGIDAVGIKSLMADAGLTHGGFYAHFRSKEKLVADALVEAFADTYAGLEKALASAKPGTELQLLIDSYLSAEHLKHMDKGCAAAALSAEVARTKKKAVKTQYTQGVNKVARLLARYLPAGASAARRQLRGLAVFACLSGILQTARALDNSDAAKHLLAQGRVIAMQIAESQW